MRVSILGVPVDRLTVEQYVERVAEMIRLGRPGRIITLNPEYLFKAVTGSPGLVELVNRADLVTADGEGIVWAGRVADATFPERVTGIDLMLALTRRATTEGWSVYLLGAAPGVAEEAAENLRLRYPGLEVAGTCHGYFKAGEEAAVARRVREAGPQLLFVALGAPKQEQWIDRHIDGIGPVVAMGVGGSFDVVAGRVTRAPRWMRRLRIEWLGRLFKEPSRWRRMLVLPRFAWLVLRTYRLERKGSR
ncbi:MAG: WecB/TagA/CpsF family glycosyltransferase [Firmicutes bacterium]|nr:WecB/TagA/CpsF family glycosyltransferase [Bacillota bacterium]